MAVIQLLSAEHRRDGFDCGDSALNEFLLRQAGQQQRRGFGKIYVALADDGVSVIGFITVSASKSLRYLYPQRADSKTNRNS